MKIVLIGWQGVNISSEEFICESVSEIWGKIIVDLMNEKVEGDFTFTLVPLDYEITCDSVNVKFDYEQLSIFSGIDKLV